MRVANSAGIITGRSERVSTYPIRILPLHSNRGPALSLRQACCITLTDARPSFCSTTLIDRRSSSLAGAWQSMVVFLTTNIICMVSTSACCSMPASRSHSVRALEKFKVVGIEDDAAGIGVFVINPQRPVKKRAHQRRPALAFPFDRKRPKALAGRHHLDAIDVDMRRQRCDPIGGLGDIRSSQRLRARVNLGG